MSAPTKTIRTTMAQSHCSISANQYVEIDATVPCCAGGCGYVCHGNVDLPWWRPLFSIAKKLRFTGARMSQIHGLLARSWHMPKQKLRTSVSCLATSSQVQAPPTFITAAGIAIQQIALCLLCVVDTLSRACADPVLQQVEHLKSDVSDE